MVKENKKLPKLKYSSEEPLKLEQWVGEDNYRAYLNFEKKCPKCDNFMIMLISYITDDAVEIGVKCSFNQKEKSLIGLRCDDCDINEYYGIILKTKLDIEVLDIQQIDDDGYDEWELQKVD